MKYANELQQLDTQEKVYLLKDLQQILFSPKKMY
jgi:hypothetical protein